MDPKPAPDEGLEYPIPPGFGEPPNGLDETGDGPPPNIEGCPKPLVVLGDGPPPNRGDCTLVLVVFEGEGPTPSTEGWPKPLDAPNEGEEKPEGPPACCTPKTDASRLYFFAKFLNKVSS